MRSKAKLRCNQAAPQRSSQIGSPNKPAQEEVEQDTAVGVIPVGAGFRRRDLTTPGHLRGDPSLRLKNGSVQDEANQSQHDPVFSVLCGFSPRPLWLKILNQVRDDLPQPQGFCSLR